MASQDQNSILDDVAGVIIVPPDGGWGWMIVMASFFCNAIVDGIIFTAGQGFQPEWKAAYGVNSGTSAWVVSLLAGFYLLAGPVVSALVNIFGCRKTALMGTAISAIGFGIGTFAPNITVLYLGVGVLGGIGFGLIYLPSIVIVGYYFEKRRALATGIAVCGSGIGTFVFAPLIRFLLHEYKWNQVLLLLSGIILNCFVFASLYRSLEPKKAQIDKLVEDMPLLERISEQKQVEMSLSAGSLRGARRRSATFDAGLHDSGRDLRLAENGAAAKSRDILQPLKDPAPESAAGDEKRQSIRANTEGAKRSRLISEFGLDDQLDKDIARSMSRESLRIINRPLSRQDIFYGGSTRNLKQFKSQPTVAHYVASTINLDTMPVEDIVEGGVISPEGTLRDTIASMLDVSIMKSPSFLMLAFSGFFTLTGFFVPFIYLPSYAISVGHDEQYATLLISILGITNIVGRVVCGWLSDRPYMNALVINNTALIIGGMATVVAPHLEAYWLLCLYCVLFGFGTACFASLRSIICVELLGLEKLTNAFGWCLMFMGIASLIGSPLAGFLYDLTGAYNISFYATGGVIVLSGIMGIPLRYVADYEKAQLERAKSAAVETPKEPPVLEEQPPKPDQLSGKRSHALVESVLLEEEEPKNSV